MTEGQKLRGSQRWLQVAVNRCPVDHSSRVPGRVPGTAPLGTLGGNVNREDREYALEPTTFHSMREAQELADALEENLLEYHMGVANVRAAVVKIFSELVNRGRLEPVNNLQCREAIVVQQRVRNKRGSNGRGYQRNALTTQREPASEC